MSLRLFVAALICIASTSAIAQTFDINLSNDAAMLTYMSELGQQGFGHGQMTGSILFTDNDDFMVKAGLGVVGEAGSGSPGLTVGVGANIYGVTTNHNDIAALAISGKIDFAPPPLPRLRVGGEVNLAPNIVTFLDGDHLYDSSVYVGYEVFQGAVAYLGYRRLKVGIQNGRDHTVDSGGYLGIKFRF